MPKPQAASTRPQAASTRPQAASTRPQAASARVLEIRVGPAADALDRFEAAWNRRAGRRAVKTLHVLTLPNLAQVAQNLSPARWSLLEELRRAGPLSIYALARRLQRNYKNVHTDVTQLAALGLIERASDNRVLVPWEVLRAEFTL